jgi:deoxycytidylate deaminase
MNEARVVKSALCLRAKCGTVIINNGEIIGVGYNAPHLDKEKNRTCLQKFNSGKPKYDKTCCMHAEWRAIIDTLKRNSEKLKGSKLYFTRIDEQGNIRKSGKPYCTVCSCLALFLLWHEEGICAYPTDECNKLLYQYTENIKS